MSVLKKIGIVLRTLGADISTVLGIPFVSSILGMIPGRGGALAAQVDTGLGVFAGLISIAETMFPAIGDAKTGAAKLAAVLPLAQAAILDWAKLNLPGHNRLLVSADVFAEHVKAFISAFVTILNDFGV